MEISNKSQKNGILSVEQDIPKLKDPFLAKALRMAVAMLTTFYGSLVANLFFIPMSAKLKRRSEEETLNMTLLFEGVVSIREGEHPRIMEDKLNVYLSTSNGKDKGKGKKPAPKKK